MILNIGLKENYLVYEIERNIIESLIASTVKELISVEDFDKKNGIVKLKMRCIFLNGKEVITEDWIDIKDDLILVYPEPLEIIQKIDKINIVGV